MPWTRLVGSFEVVAGGGGVESGWPVWDLAAALDSTVRADSAVERLGGAGSEGD